MTRRRKQNIKLALVCAILGAIVLMTIFAPWLAPYDPLEVTKKHINNPAKSANFLE